MAAPLELRVIYGDTDAMGVVYHSNYLRYFEASRAHFIRVRGRSYKDIEAAGYMLPVIEANVRYRLPLRYDDLFVVRAVVSERKRVTATFSYQLHRGTDLMAEGWTRHACLDRSGRPVVMPATILDLLDAPEGV